LGLLGSTIVQIVFSDESGCGDDTVIEPLAVVTAILLNMDNQWEPVRKELEAIRVMMPPKLLDKKHFSLTEIKGSLLFKGLRNKINKILPSTAAEALCRILLLVPKHSIHIFHGAIDRVGRKNFVKRFDAPEISEQEEAFRECLGRLEDFVHGFLPKEKVLWIADHGGYETAIKEGLRFHRMMQVLDLTEYLRGKYASDTEEPIGIASWGRGIKLRDDPEAASTILDTIYFGHSHESLALQLADVCCSVITQHLIGLEDGSDFYEIIRRQVRTDGNQVVYSPAWGGKNVEP
jgi:hypothetical protein